MFRDTLFNETHRFSDGLAHPRLRRPHLQRNNAGVTLLRPATSRSVRRRRGIPNVEELYETYSGANDSPWRQGEVLQGSRVQLAKGYALDIPARRLLEA